MERRYRLLFESSPHPMWIHDSESLRFLAVNQTMVQFYGYSREELLSMSLPDLEVQRHAGIRADMRFAGDEWIVAEDGVQAGVLDHKQLITANGVRAEAMSRGVSLRVMACADLNHWRVSSIRPRTAIGVSHSSAACRVRASKAVSGMKSSTS